MKIKERRQRIVDLVNDWGNLSVGFLAKKFNVSDFDLIIIDSNIQDEHLESLKKFDINLEIVGISSR